MEQSIPRTEHEAPLRTEHYRRRTIGGLFGDLFRETTDLLHGEVDLLRADLSEKVSQVQTGVSEIGAGWLITFAGVLTLLAAAVIGLAYVVPIWLSALIIGGVVTIIGLAMMAAGRKNLKTRNLAPGHTAESLRKDRDMIRERM